MLLRFHAYIFWILYDTIYNTFLVNCGEFLYQLSLGFLCSCSCFCFGVVCTEGLSIFLYLDEVGSDNIVQLLFRRFDIGDAQTY